MSTKARQFFAASAGLPGLPGGGLPHDRMARMAARRVFVDLKSVFMAAVACLPGRDGDWLRKQVRAAEEPVDLWLLRAAVLGALTQQDEATLQWRRQLKRSLEQIFPDSAGAGMASGFGAFAQA
jgi:hypothetical protein